MADIQQTMETYNKMKEDYERKVGLFTQQLSTLAADIQALPVELKGASQELIDRKTKRLQEKLEKTTKKVQDWIEEQKKKIEDWLETEKKKIEDYLKEQIEIETEALKLKTYMQIYILTGQVPPNIEVPTELPAAIKKQEERHDDKDYEYYYKDDLGVWKKSTLSEVAKRKAFPESKLNVYSTAFNDKEQEANLLNLGIKRIKKEKA